MLSFLRLVRFPNLLIIALVQLLRLILGWEVVIQGHLIPMWVSGLAFVVAGGLALTVWRETP